MSYMLSRKLVDCNLSQVDFFLPVEKCDELGVL